MRSALHDIHLSRVGCLSIADDVVGRFGLLARPNSAPASLLLWLHKDIHFSRLTMGQRTRSL